jgi:SAM-dependent methyltransferase
MAQNVYDDPAFFDRYCALPRSIEGLDGAPEWPALRGLLPDADGRRVVDLGCGFGWFCRWAAQRGAASVLGIDLSERMLARAAHDTVDASIAYVRADLDELRLPAGEFDIAYSSLALHYVIRLPELIATVYAALVPGGEFVFSVEHPIFTAPSRPGFVTGDDGALHWPLDHYLVEGARTTDWLAPGVVKQHRTIGTYFAILAAAGFRVTALVEWGPTADQVIEVPAWAQELDRPPFLLMRATR